MPTLQVPSAGRIVLYKLTADDAAKINGMISDAQSRERRCIGNKAAAGDVLPMLIVRAWGDTPTSSVNGQVFLDGLGSLWVTSRSVGEQNGNWAWPERAPAVTSPSPGTGNAQGGGADLGSGQQSQNEPDQKPSGDPVAVPKKKSGKAK